MFDLDTPGWSREHDLELVKTFLRGLVAADGSRDASFGKALRRTAGVLLSELESGSSSDAGRPAGSPALASAPIVLERLEAPKGDGGSKVVTCKLDVLPDGFKFDASGEGEIPPEAMALIRTLGGLLSRKTRNSVAV